MNEILINKYDIHIQKTSIIKNLERITNQIYKLLPGREEGEDWIKPLETLIEEVAGMTELLKDYQDILFALLCKMEGMKILNKDEDFLLFRRSIFECLNLISNLKRSLL